MAQAGIADDKLRMVIIGAGRVGTTTAYAALLTGVADEITMVDAERERAEGEAMDLIHGLPFMPPAEVHAGGYDACANADLIVLTAGAPRQQGDSRLDLARRNLDLLAAVAPQVAAENPDALLLIVSNPVDLITLAVRRLLGFRPERVIGTGTVLDSARLRAVLARHFQVDARSVHSYILGEHGDSQFPAWSLARIGGATLDSFARAAGREWGPEVRERLAAEVRQAGAEVIRRKGGTHFAIGLATARLARALLHDERSVHTVSTELVGEMGLRDVALSLPCVLGRAGRITLLPLDLDDVERRALDASADLLRSA